MVFHIHLSLHFSVLTYTKNNSIYRITIPLQNTHNIELKRYQEHQQFIADAL